MAPKAGLTDRDALDIQPIPGTAGERLEDDQVFRAAREDDGTRRDGEIRGTRDGVLFERHGAERDIQRNAPGRAQQEDPVSKREFARVWQPTLEAGEEHVNEWRLTAEAGDHREIGVLGQAGLTPSLDREAADETEAPALGAAKGLDLQRRGQQRVHAGGRLRWNRAC